MTVVGIGVDLVDVARFERALERTPRLRTRLFTTAEHSPAGKPRSSRSLAARFAAKEALIKAFGDSWAMRWHDITVVENALGDPSFKLFGAANTAAANLGIRNVRVTMSHDAGLAIAMVVAED